MRNIKIGDKLQIHCYKHNGKLYRVCDEATVLENNDKMLVCANYKSEIMEYDGIKDSKMHKYFTKESAILFFFKDTWFNIIAQLKSDGVYYYCNMASPYIIDDGLIKYIDYDLDLRVYPDGSFKVLDRNEYHYHKNKMNYGEKIDIILSHELTNLINLKKNGKDPFNIETIKKYSDQYENIKNGII